MLGASLYVSVLLWHVMVDGSMVITARQRGHSRGSKRSALSGQDTNETVLGDKKSMTNKDEATHSSRETNKKTSTLNKNNNNNKRRYLDSVKPADTRDAVNTKKKKKNTSKGCVHVLPNNKNSKELAEQLGIVPLTAPDVSLSKKLDEWRKNMAANFHGQNRESAEDAGATRKQADMPRIATNPFRVNSPKYEPHSPRMPLSPQDGHAPREPVVARPLAPSMDSPYPREPMAPSEGRMPLAGKQPVQANLPLEANGPAISASPGQAAQMQPALARHHETYLAPPHVQHEWETLPRPAVVLNEPHAVVNSAVVGPVSVPKPGELGISGSGKIGAPESSFCASCAPTSHLHHKAIGNMFRHGHDQPLLDIGQRIEHKAKRLHGGQAMANMPQGPRHQILGHYHGHTKRADKTATGSHDRRKQKSTRSERTSRGNGNTAQVENTKSDSTPVARKRWRPADSDASQDSGNPPKALASKTRLASATARHPRHTHATRRKQTGLLWYTWTRRTKPKARHVPRGLFPMLGRRADTLDTRFR